MEGREGSRDVGAEDDCVVEDQEKNEQNENSEKVEKKFPRPNVLHLSSKDDITDATTENSKNDEWYEMVTAVSPSNNEIGRTDQKTDNDGCNTSATGSNIIGGSCLDHIDMEPDNVAEIEALEQSLTTLLDDFRSGRMSALNDEKLKMMRKARQEMEDLTAFHVKLHKLQTSNFSNFSDDSELDEQYDKLFKKLDKLYCFLRDMSFGTADLKKDGTYNITGENEPYVRKE